MDNALLEERNAELLHIARLARSARGKKQALDPAMQSKLEALSQPVALSHPTGLDAKSAQKSSSNNIKGRTTDKTDGRGTDMSDKLEEGEGGGKADVALLPKTPEYPGAEEEAAAPDKVQVVVNLDAPAEIEMHPPERLSSGVPTPEQPTSVLAKTPSNLNA